MEAPNPSTEFQVNPPAYRQTGITQIRNIKLRLPFGGN